MPRKAPDKVIEHRISLSNFERNAIIEELQKQRENALFSSGINQIGAIAGSSLLLYGILAYLGIDLVSKAKDAIGGFVDTQSTNLADFLGDIVGVPLDTNQAQGIINSNDRLDEAIVYHRNMERANSLALTALTNQLRDGDLTFDQFRAQASVLSAEGDQLDYLRDNINTVRRYVQMIRTFALPAPSWMGYQDWKSLIISALAEGSPYSPNSDPAYTKPVSTLLSQ